VPVSQLTPLLPLFVHLACKAALALTQTYMQLCPYCACDCVSLCPLLLLLLLLLGLAGVCLQDWFGTDLKIRRIGQYWTMLEYVLEVRGSSSVFHSDGTCSRQSC
jgi:hypothetical protein